MESENHYWHNLSAEKTAEVLETDIDKGLSEKEVILRQRKFGPNSLPERENLGLIACRRKNHYLKLRYF